MLVKTRDDIQNIDEGDNDPVSFLSYNCRSSKCSAWIGQDVSTNLQGSQNPLDSPILSLLINELSSVPNDFAMVMEIVLATAQTEITHERNRIASGGNSISIS